MPDPKNVEKPDFYPNQICQNLSDFGIRVGRNVKFIQTLAQASNFSVGLDFSP
jgi:hypothetical protein